MSQEENIKKNLIDKFKYLENSIRTPRPRRIFLDVDLKNFAEVFDYAVKQLNFTHLCAITGLDEQDKLGFIYHLAQTPGLILNLKTTAPKDGPAIKTVMPYFPNAEIYERELVDLFGAKVEGLPSGNRYPLTNDWPKDQYPLRKDWRAENA